MKIPVGNFGFNTAPAESQRRAQPGAFVNEGLTAIGQSLSAVAGDMMAEERRKQREAEAEAKAAKREADRVKALTAQAQAKNQLADLQDEFALGLDNGSLDKSTIPQNWAERSRKVIDDAVGLVAPEHQDLIRADLEMDYGRAQRNITKLVAQRDREDVSAGLVAYVEQMQRYAQKGDEQRQEAIANVDAFLRVAGPQAGLRQDQIEKQAQGFKEGVTFTWLDNRVSSLAESNKAQKGILKELAGGAYGELDPAKRNYLETKIQRNIDHNNLVSERAYNRRMSELDRYTKRLSWYVENGQEIPAKELVEFDKASRGTPYGGMVKQILAEQKQVAEFSRLAPGEQIAKFNELRKSYGPTPSKEQIQHLAKVGAFVEKSVQFLRETPLEYAVQREGAMVEPIDLDKPESWQSNLQARVAILTEQSRRTGTEPKGLFAQEAQALAGVLAQSGDAEKGQILAMLRQGFSDDRVFRATMQQIAKDSPVTAVAGMIASREKPLLTPGGLFSADKSFSPGSTAAIMLRGERLLNPQTGDKAKDGKPKFPMPKEADMLREFNKYTEGVYAGAPEAYSIDYQAFKATYAGLASDKDYSGEINSKLAKEAVLRSTGGVIDFNGNGNVLKPWGMSDDEFKTKARAAALQGLARAGHAYYTPERFGQIGLQNFKGSQYVIRAGAGVLTDAAGKPVIIDLDSDNADYRRRVESIPK